ncbi:MAG: NAD-dependent protein deacylase [Acholeplasmatales bacterium]|nr:NAD-dependent protein deacylase [Acholeplasmatales bacterium]
MEKLEKLMNIIKESNDIVFFGGAGVSVASGIPDFRGANGLYNYTPEEIISHHFFMDHTKEFYDFYWDKMVYKNALPNACHKALAYLEEKGKLRSIITQNIDGLHQKALSKNVLELHGSVNRNYCMRCHKFYDLSSLETKGIPHCTCGGIIKPDVVLYEEGLDETIITRAISDISNCDTLIVAGTSLVVYPAASFIRYFRGKNLIIINLGQTSYDIYTTLAINGKVEEYLNIDNFKKYNI